MDVLFDRQNNEGHIRPFPDGPKGIGIFTGYSGPHSALYEHIVTMLRTVVGEDGELRNDELRFGVGTRWQRRVALMSGDRVVLPNIFQLSTGQSLLLNIGLSILRDFDLSESKMRSLDDIMGLVVIDEVDLHLHVDFQHSVLPKLLKLFPRVQFVMTSHSPLFLLGMKEAFGPEGFHVISMPDMSRTQVECFSEFSRAYAVYRGTETHLAEVKAAIRDANSPMVFLEGDTDIRYVRRAAELLGEGDFLAGVQLCDGGGAAKMCNTWKGLKNGPAVVWPQPVMLVYDCDADKPSEEIGTVARRTLSRIAGNPVQKGIENLLAEETLQRVRTERPEFIDSVASHMRLERGKEVMVAAQWTVNADEKANLCTWLCENGSADDFKGFATVFQVIRDALTALQRGGDS